MNIKSVLFLNRLLSFRYLALGLFVSRLLKYFFFGVYGFGQHWNVTPTLHHHLGFIWDECVNPYLWFVVVGFVLDRLVGPLFFRQETAELERIVYE